MMIGILYWPPEGLVRRYNKSVQVDDKQCIYGCATGSGFYIVVLLLLGQVCAQALLHRDASGTALAVTVPLPVPVTGST